MLRSYTICFEPSCYDTDFEMDFAHAYRDEPKPVRGILNQIRLFESWRRAHKKS